MKKLYYISYLNNWGVGINNKIQIHIKLFEKNHFDVKYISIGKKNNKYIKLFQELIPFLTENDYKKLKIIESDSLIYIRYNKLDLKGLFAIRKLYKKGCKIVMEIPTYPYDYEYKSVYKIFLYKDKISRHFIHKYVRRIITYSNDRLIYKIPTIRISNFVDLNRVTKINPIQDNKDEIKDINLIAVACFAFWHGYDRIIKGLKKYYESSNLNKKIYFHIVGDGKEVKKYKKIVSEENLDKYVIFYGNKTGNELDDIYTKCTLGIDALGRHRTRVKYNSTLKSKEYLAKGLPIISGVDTELDYDKCFPYYLRVPSNDEIIDMNMIIEFFDDIYNQNNRSYVIESIRNYAEMNFNDNVSFAPVINYFSNEL